MEQIDDSAFKFSSTGATDGVGRERLPDDILTDVGGNEQGNTRAETITLLQHLVQTYDDNAGKEKLAQDTTQSENRCILQIAFPSRFPNRRSAAWQGQLAMKTGNGNHKAGLD